MPIRRRQFASSNTPAETAPIVRLWLLRLLVSLGAQRQFVSSVNFSDDALADMLGLGHWIESDEFEFDQKAVRTELRRLHRAAERELGGVKAPVRLGANVARLAKLVGLSDTDCRILEFAVMIRTERLLDETADLLGVMSSVGVLRVLSVVLELPEPDVRSALGAHGILARSGLVVMDRNGVFTLSGKIELLSDQFADHIFSSDADPVSLLRDTVAPGSPAQLALDDYSHIAPCCRCCSRI